MSPERLQPLWNQNMRVKGKKKNKQTKKLKKQRQEESRTPLSSEASELSHRYYCGGIKKQTKKKTAGRQVCGGETGVLLDRQETDRTDGLTEGTDGQRHEGPVRIAHRLLL